MEDLTIHYAQYGTSTVKKDVIDIVTKRITSNDRLNLLVSNDTFGGDFLPGKHKFLHIIYTFNGIFYDERIDELDLLIIPKPQIIKLIEKQSNNGLILILLAIFLFVYWRRK